MSSCRSRVLAQIGDFQWEGVPRTAYKEDGAHWRGVSRTELVSEPSTANLPFHVRYFEIDSGGYSSLERHEHEHVVLVVSGKGTVRLGEASKLISEGDIVHVRSREIHQFVADQGSRLGFYCIVAAERDRPETCDGGANSCDWSPDGPSLSES